MGRNKYLALMVIPSPQSAAIRANPVPAYPDEQRFVSARCLSLAASYLPHKPLRLTTTVVFHSSGRGETRTPKAGWHAVDTNFNLFTQWPDELLPYATLPFALPTLQLSTNVTPPRAITGVACHQVSKTVHDFDLRGFGTMNYQTSHGHWSAMSNFPSRHSSSRLLLGMVSQCVSPCFTRSAVSRWHWNSARIERACTASSCRPDSDFHYRLVRRAGSGFCVSPSTPRVPFVQKPRQIAALRLLWQQRAARIDSHTKLRHTAFNEDLV